MPNPPTLRKVNPADSPIVFLALSSPTLPLSAVNEYAETVLAQRLSSLPGVVQVVPERMPADEFNGFGTVIPWNDSGWWVLRELRMTNLARELVGQDVHVIHALDSRLWRGAAKIAEKAGLPRSAFLNRSRAVYHAPATKNVDTEGVRKSHARKRPEPVAHEHPAAQNELASVGPPGQAQEDAFEQPVAGRVRGNCLGRHAGKCSRPGRGGPGAPPA